jgi:nucleoside 2-deoxyribosyltransferase
VPHSLGALVKAYLASPVFKNTAAETQRTRRNILERFAAANGDKPSYYNDATTGERIMPLKRSGMQKIVNEKAATRSAQRNFVRSRLRPNVLRCCQKPSRLAQGSSKTSVVS